MAFIEVIPFPENQELVDRLTQIGRRATDVEPAFELVVESFHRIEAHKWSEEGPGWDAYAPPSDRSWGTVYRREMLDVDGQPMLTRTYDLFFSLAGGEPGGGIQVMTPDSVFMGTDIPYAQYHQEGTKWMPARPVVDINEATLLLWGNLIHNYVVHGIFEAAAEEDVLGVL